MQTNFISSVQTSRIRIRITGYSFKNMLASFLQQGKKATYAFVLIIRFRQFGAENFFINSFQFFLKLFRII